MATLAVTTVLPAPDGSGEPFRVLQAGDELPDWAADLVGDHCLTEQADVPVKAPRKASHR